MMPDDLRWNRESSIKRFVSAQDVPDGMVAFVEVARRTGMNPMTARRWLHNFASAGYFPGLDVHPGEGYLLVMTTEQAARFRDLVAEVSALRARLEGLGFKHGVPTR